MKMIYRLNALRLPVLCLLLSIPYWSGAQSIRSSVDKKNILIGEQITFRMSVGLPSPEYKVIIDVPDSIPHFDILQKSGGSATGKKGEYSFEYRMVLTSFDSGRWIFPAMVYRISHRNTASQGLLTDTFTVNVGYMPIDPGGKPRDIKSILEVSFYDWFWVWVAAGALLLLLLVYLLYRYLKSRKKTAPAKAAMGAYDEAMKALDELKKANDAQSLTVKEYHTRLADVLKNYYSKKVDRNFSNKTTAEILTTLKSHELKAETESHTAEALQTGDAVKFAKYRSTYTENEAALNYLKNTIQEIEGSLSKKT
ncbi:MAG: DUF4381 family protein [Ferruginibacter sp.]